MKQETTRGNPSLLLPALVSIFLVILTVTNFWRVGGHDFINFDDNQYVTENPKVLNGLSWSNVRWAFTSGYASNWHPLTWLSHMVDVELFGLKPGPHHLVNVAFHAANTALLFLFLFSTTRALWPSGFVAALFALHPLHVESVAWVAERKDVLSTFFLMLTLLAYAKFVKKADERNARPGVSLDHTGMKGGGGKEVTSKRSSMGSAQTAEDGGYDSAILDLNAWTRSYGYYSLALLAFVCGLMSKPMLVTVPFLLLLLDVWPLGRFVVDFRKLSLKPLFASVLEKLPFFAMAAISSYITYAVQSGGGSVSNSLGLPLHARMANAVVSYAQYIGKTFVPNDLAIFYPHPGLKSAAHAWPAWQIFAAATMLAAVSAGALYIWKKRPFLATGWFWFLGTLVPVIGLVQVGGQAMADRYTYVPLIGIFICLAWAAAGILPANRTFRILGGIALTGILATCIVLTQKQLATWKNNLSVFQHALAVTKDNAPALYNIGIEAGKSGNAVKAEEHFKAALNVNPNYAEAASALAYTLGEQKKYDEAITYYRAAIKMKPNYMRAHINLGSMYWSIGDADRALTQFQEAVRIAPKDPEAYRRIGALLADQGKLEEARIQFTRLLELQPTKSAPRILLGELDWQAGQREAALDQFAAAVRLEPENVGIRRKYAASLLQEGRNEQAQEQFAAVLQNERTNYQSWLDMGQTLAVQGQFSTAEEHLRQALELNPTNLECIITLGNVLSELGKTNEAKAEFTKANQRDPGLGAKFLSEGRQLLANGELDLALAKTLTSLRLEPKSIEATEQAGAICIRKGDFNPAARYFETALALRPSAFAHANLGMLASMEKQVEPSMAHYRRALELDPNSVMALNDLAWILSTSSEPSLLNGKEAVRLAERAAQLTKSEQPMILGTLAAAYAEAGDFQKAIQTAEQAKELATKAGLKQVADRNAELIELYKAGKPFREK